MLLLISQTEELHDQVANFPIDLNTLWHGTSNLLQKCYRFGAALSGCRVAVLIWKNKIKFSEKNIDGSLYEGGEKSLTLFANLERDWNKFRNHHKNIGKIEKTLIIRNTQKKRKSSENRSSRLKNKSWISEIGFGMQQTQHQDEQTKQGNPSKTLTIGYTLYLISLRPDE